MIRDLFRRALLWLGVEEDRYRTYHDDAGRIIAVVDTWELRRSEEDA
jgi:hypothetical protein